MTSAKEVLQKYLKKVPKPFNSIIENGDKVDNFKYVDIERLESLSPMEMELRIQADRVMFSLNKTLSVLCVMAHLTHLLKNNLLHANFPPRELNFIIFVLKTYENQGFPEIMGESENQEFGGLYDTVNRIKAVKNRFQASQETRIDFNLAQVIHMIYTNKCIREEIKKAVDPVAIPFIINFIRSFEELKDMAKIKLYITGTEEEARDKRLRKAYKSNIMLTAAIKDLEQQLESQGGQLGNEVSKKVEIFDRYNEKIAKIREEFQISIEKNIHESERRMMQQCIESDEKQSSLAVEAEAITQQYEKLLEADLAAEKALRVKTMKTQNQLYSWLTKYDQDFGEKQTEYEELKNQYDNEKAALDDLDAKMGEQEEVYNTAMAEKTTEEERIFNELAFKLLCHRSARIIQRAWRAYRDRKSKRKGKKGGKKGKGKEEQKPQTRLTRKTDANALLESKFTSEVFKEMKNPNAF